MSLFYITRRNKNTENEQTVFLCQFLEKSVYSLFSRLSCKDIRDSGDSKVDGEYWIDPAKDGNPLKVYCDMTTDEGKMKFS